MEPITTKESRSRSPSPSEPENDQSPDSPPHVVTTTSSHDTATTMMISNKAKSPTIRPATIAIPETKSTSTTKLKVTPSSPKTATTQTRKNGATSPTKTRFSATTRQRARTKRGRKSGFVFIGACLLVYIWNMQSHAQMGLEFYQLDQELRLAAMKSEEALMESVTAASKVPFSVASIILFLLLTLQCGIQPILIKFFMPEGVIKSTCVLGQEVSKFCMSISFLLASGKWSEAVEEWTWESAFVAAGVPAVIFTTQTYLNLMANQVLPPVTFAVLNQTKTLSTAFCCFVIMNKPQSRLQIVALFLLVISALVNQKILPLPCEKKEQDENNNRNGDLERQTSTATDDITVDSIWDETDKRQLFQGVLPALCASFLSGLAGALTQKTLTQHARNPHLFNLELAVFSSMFLLSTLALGSPDGRHIRKKGFWKGWTWKTFIPIATNAIGAILVGLVTKYMGAVVKGFTTIFGMILSGILQQVLLSGRGEQVTWAQFVSGCIGAFSLWMHTANPP